MVEDPDTRQLAGLIASVIDLHVRYRFSSGGSIEDRRLGGRESSYTAGHFDSFVERNRFPTFMVSRYVDEDIYSVQFLTSSHSPILKKVVGEFKRAFGSIEQA